MATATAQVGSKLRRLNQLFFITRLTYSSMKAERVRDVRGLQWIRLHSSQIMLPSSSSALLVRRLAGARQTFVDFKGFASIEFISPEETVKLPSLRPNDFHLKQLEFSGTVNQVLQFGSLVFKCQTVN